MGRKREGRRKGRRIMERGAGGGIIAIVVVVVVLEMECRSIFVDANPRERAPRRKLKRYTRTSSALLSVNAILFYFYLTLLV